MTAGYRGKSIADSGYYYAPYIPEIPVTWRDHLNYYNRQISLNTPTPEQKLNPGKTLAECAHYKLQKHWPGAYVVEEYYDSTRGCFALRLKFQDPHEEVMWRLRWS
jgi:hypothetical protein